MRFDEIQPSAKFLLGTYHNVQECCDGAHATLRTVSGEAMLNNERTHRVENQGDLSHVDQDKYT